MARRNPSRILAATLAGLAACATYRPEPIEPAEILARLEAVDWRPAEAGAAGARTVGPRELAAFAVEHQPGLAAARAEIGVRHALLLEAGLLPDPELGWDAMDVIAAQIVDGSSSAVDVLSGFGLMFPLPRPGERDARVGAAEWRVEEARRRVMAAEWELARDVHVAFEEVRASENLLAQTRALTELAESTDGYFERARAAGAATAIQANLARGELQAMRLDTVRAEARALRGHQALNALLGLPPDTELPLGEGEDPSARAALREGVAALTEHAVTTRPDLATLLARYRASEEEVRLAVATRFPLISIGTGLRLTLPVFSHFGRPAMRTAIAERARVANDFTAAVHGTRAEIAATHARWVLAAREAELVEGELLPNAERNLELSREAFLAGEVTLLETLALQRALVEARTRRTETRAARAKRAWELLAASGWFLGPETDATDDAETPR